MKKHALKGLPADGKHHKFISVSVANKKVSQQKINKKLKKAGLKGVSVPKSKMKKYALKGLPAGGKHHKFVSVSVAKSSSKSS
jgi:hypothetical protein